VRSELSRARTDHVSELAESSSNSRIARTQSNITFAGLTTHKHTQTCSARHNGFRVEGRGAHVSSSPTYDGARVETKANTTFAVGRYNRYLAVAARVVRRSLKEDKRVQAERRGEMELRFARWEVGQYTSR
jgi:hypothetical protein